MFLVSINRGTPLPGLSLPSFRTETRGFRFHESLLSCANFDVTTLNSDVILKELRIFAYARAIRPKHREKKMTGEAVSIADLITFLRYAVTTSSHQQNHILP